MRQGGRVAGKRRWWRCGAGSAASPPRPAARSDRRRSSTSAQPPSAPPTCACSASCGQRRTPSPQGVPLSLRLSTHLRLLDLLLGRAHRLVQRLAGRDQGAWRQRWRTHAAALLAAVACRRCSALHCATHGIRSSAQSGAAIMMSAHPGPAPPPTCLCSRACRRGARSGRPASGCPASRPSRLSLFRRSFFRPSSCGRRGRASTAHVSARRPQRKGGFAAAAASARPVVLQAGHSSGGGEAGGGRGCRGRARSVQRQHAASVHPHPSPARHHSRSSGGGRTATSMSSSGSSAGTPLGKRRCTSARLAAHRSRASCACAGGGEGAVRGQRRIRLVAARWGAPQPGRRRTALTACRGHDSRETAQPHPSSTRQARRLNGVRRC